MWRGPPRFSRARTRSTRTSNPQYFNRCWNFRSSHADHTARTPPGRVAGRGEADVAVERRIAGGGEGGRTVVHVHEDGIERGGMLVQRVEGVTDLHANA